MPEGYRAVRRPDGRTFVSFTGDRSAASLARVLDSVDGPVHTVASESDAHWLEALGAAGFEPFVVVEGFRIRFDRVLDLLPVAATDRFELVAAHEIAIDRLAELDAELRNDVPGTDGWQPDTEWTAAELEDSPPYDPEGYLVAIDRQAAGAPLAGLLRIWRNDPEPRLGLLAIRRPYRRTRLAVRLLTDALTPASRWGSDTFVAETSTAHPSLHRRLTRIADESTGRIVTLVAGPRGS